MSDLICRVCKSPKASFKCGICHIDLCKKCTEFQETEAFTLMKSIPEEISHSHYCAPCFTMTIIPAQIAYEEILGRAKEVFILDKPRRRAPKFAAKSNELLKVEQCKDRAEVLLRLAFLAAEQGHNAVIKANIVCEKIRAHSYQKLFWHGTGYPATLDGKRL